MISKLLTQDLTGRSRLRINVTDSAATFSPPTGSPIRLGVTSTPGEVASESLSLTADAVHRLRDAHPITLSAR